MIHRPFNKSIIVDDYFIKISKNERLADEIYYYQCLQKFDQKNLFAEFFGDVSDGIYYGLKLKYYQCENIYETIKSDQKLSPKLFDQILFILNELHSNKPISLCETQINNLNEKILIDKTEFEFSNFEKKSNIIYDHLKLKNKLIINKKECYHFQTIWPKIKKIIISEYLTDELSMIHGDFCFANILHLKKDHLLLIDPRGSYFNKGLFGDKSYDFAKFLHSVHGNYEQIIYDDYYLKISDNNHVSLSFKYDFSVYDNEIKKIIGLDNYLKSKLIEGLLFISMCSRHYENEFHQFVMYCQGLIILNDFYNESIQDRKLSII